MGNEMGNNNTSGLRDYITEDKSQREVDHGDDLKAQNHVVPASQSKDPNGDEQKTDNTEEVNMKTEGKKSRQDAARTDDDEGRNHGVRGSEDMYVNEKEIGLASEGLTELHDANQKQDEKEPDNNTIPEDKDQSTHGNVTKLFSSEPDGKAHLVDNWKQDEKGTNLLEAKENCLPEAASTEEIKAQAGVVPAAADKNTNGIEIGLVSKDPYGSTFPCVDDQKEDEKEEDVSINDEAKEKSHQEAATTDVVERQDHQLPAVEDTNTRGNETWLVSSGDSGETSYPRTDNPKPDEKEDDNTNAETQEKPVAEDDHRDDVQAKNLTISAAEGADYNNTEAELASVDLMAVENTLDNHTLKQQVGPSMSIEEQGKIEHHPTVKSAKIEAKSCEAVGEGMEQQPAASSENLEYHEMPQESGFEENLSGTSHHFENQNSPIEENERTRNLDSDAASSTLHDSVPQEPAALEPEERESAKILTEQLVQVRDGPLKSQDMIIIPSLTCLDQENGFILDSTISTCMAESVFELGNITTIMANLSDGVKAKCSGELPSEMNSTRNDSPESMVEAILSEETHNFLLEVSETDDKGIDLSQKATMVKEESETGISKHSHCQIQSGSDGIGYEEGSNADEPNASLPQFMMSENRNEEKQCPLNTCCDSKSSDSKECQDKEAKIVENGQLVDLYINYQNEVSEEQQKDSQKEVNLVSNFAVISANAFLMDQKSNEEESEEERITQVMVEKFEDSNPIGNETSRRENGEECIVSYPIEKAEAFLSPSTFLHALPEKQQEDSDVVCKRVQNCNQSITELNQESFAEFRDLLGRPKSTPVTMEETKPSAKQSNEQYTIGESPAVIANGDYYYQRESVGRLSNESNPDSMSIHAQMQKSPSFNLDLRINARAEESDQTPLLYQDKTTTMESFSNQADVTDLPGKPVADTDYETMQVEEKVITLERSDSEKSKPPFLKDEQGDPMVIIPKKQANQSAANQTTSKVSAMEVKSASTKGKEKRKPRTFLFGTCICCATVIN